jgi:hypothetical protein
MFLVFETFESINDFVSYFCSQQNVVQALENLFLKHVTMV